MPETHETEVERDADGRVIGYKQHIDTPKHRGGGFGWGLLFCLLIAIIGIGAFAYNHGSFEGAGRSADQVTAQAEQKAGVTAHQAARSLDNAGDQAQQTAQQTQQQSQQ